MVTCIKMPKITMKMNLKCSFSLSLDLDVNNVFSCEFGISGGKEGIKDGGCVCNGRTSPATMENLKKKCIFFLSIMERAAPPFHFHFSICRRNQNTSGRVHPECTAACKREYWSKIHFCWSFLRKTVFIRLRTCKRNQQAGDSKFKS